MKGYKKIPVCTWYLCHEGTIPKGSSGAKIERWWKPDREEYLDLYRFVGTAWGWTGRLLMSNEELQEKLLSDTNEVWRIYVDDTLIGFFEIDRLEAGKAEIVYLGLLPGEIGKGLGRKLMEAAISCASKNNENEVWLHTCTFDHPNALQFYLRNGFRIVKESLEDEYYAEEFLKQWGEKNPEK